MAKDPLVQPFLKWAGGKRQLLPEINKYVPESYTTFYEPFVGAGAVFMELQHNKVVINDFNGELINTYQVIKNDVNSLIELLKNHKEENSKEYFYKVRELDRTEIYEEWDPIKKAARLIYLNKTCFNGLYRVNSRNQFNVPFGSYKNPNIVNEPALRALSNYLKQNDIKILNGDFEQAVSDAKEGDFIYFDPPYDHVTKAENSFTAYTLNGFGKDEQERLRDLFVSLDKRGCKIMLSNASTDFIHEIYKDYNIITVKAMRNINSKGNGRGKIDEVLVMNYDEIK